LIPERAPAKIAFIGRRFIRSHPGHTQLPLLDIVITDALITQLAKLPGLRVISRTSIMQYKNSRRPLPDIARALSVDAVVEGSVSRSSNRVRVTAQLVDARADRHLWAEEYDRDLRDILTLQSELARDISEQVRANISSGQLRVGAVEPAAYESYLRGRSFWNQRTPAGLNQAIGHFQRAIELDPGYAEAYSGLADAYAALGYTSFSSPRDAFPRARELARRAWDRPLAIFDFSFAGCETAGVRGGRYIGVL